MSDVVIEDLLDRVRPECGRCPTDLMKQEMVNVIRDFCQQTRAWQYEVENESILQGVSDYDIELPNTQAYPIAIEAMTLDGSPITFKSKEWLDGWVQNWRYREADDFSCFTHINPKVITFPCVPQSTGTVGGLYYRVSLKPVANADEVPQELADEWIEAWSDGTKAHLKAMTDKPWTDVKRADQLEARYRSARAGARIRVSRSYGNSSDKIVGPRTFG